MVKNLAVEKLFLFLALVFGLLYVFILPPFQSVDEDMHFFRTYQISEGKLFAQNIDGRVGDEIPASLSKFYDLYFPFIKNIDTKSNAALIKETFNLKTNPENTVFTEFRNTALYSPVCYLSQLPGVILGKFFTKKLSIIYYLGRLSNLIFYCILAFLAIRLIPFYKLPLLCLAVMPMSLSLAGAYTCDTAVLGLNFLWIALLLKILTAEKEIEFSNKYFLFLLLTGFLVGLSKSYILLLPLAFLLPVKKFKTKKDYFLAICSILFSMLSGFVLWSFSIKGLTLDMNDTVADAVMQKEFILIHPLQYLAVLIKTFLVKTPRLYITMVGVLGWQDTRLDWITYMVYPFLVYFGIKADNFDFELKKWQKILIAATLVIAVVLTYTSLYIMWSPVGNDVVLGLNGKYFIPLMLPLFLLFKSRCVKYDYDKVKAAVFIALIFILASSELSLLHRFYDITPNLYYKV